MRGAAFFADIGSTFTKGLVVSLDSCERVCSGQAATSLENGVEKGFENLREELLSRSGFTSFGLCLASSSAKGGLRVAALGLMPELTVKAAGAACLNAGARLLFCHSHRLGAADLARMEKSAPDVIFLAGGTDGGEKECVLHNARVLAGSRAGGVVLFAGNREAAEEVRGLLEGREVFFAENVLPELDVLNIGPARETLREIFLSRIASAKGLGGIAGQVDAPITPTPSAVFEAAALLYERAGPQFGEGGLIVVDAGGATTDVYSAAAGSPSGGRVVLRGMPEPLLKRTVEGDIGLRSSLSGLMDEVKRRRAPGAAGAAGALEWAEKASGEFSRLPRTRDELRRDALLAGYAVKIALERHCGRLEEHYSPGGRVFVQKGKDLRAAGVVFASGGVFAGNRFAVSALESVLEEGWGADILAPAAPRIVPDRHYVLYAAGLLSSVDRDAAFSIMEGNLIKNAA